jgi:hypothetical protein
MHSGSEQRTEGLSLRLPVGWSPAVFQPSRWMTRDPSTRPGAEMPSQMRHKRPARLRPYRRRQRAQSRSRTFPSPNLPCQRTLPSPDFPCWETLRSSNLPWRPAAPTKRMSRPASARRRTWSGSRLALRVRSHPGELRCARLVHLECRTETSRQAAGGGRCSGALAHRQSRSPGEPPPSPPQSVSSWVRPYLPWNSWYAARPSTLAKK